MRPVTNLARALPPNSKTGDAPMFYDPEMRKLMDRLGKLYAEPAEDAPEMADYPEFPGNLNERPKSQFERDLWINPHE